MEPGLQRGGDPRRDSARARNGALGAKYGEVGVSWGDHHHHHHDDHENGGISMLDFHGLAQETVPIRVIQVPTAIHMSMPHHKAQEDPGDV